MPFAYSNLDLIMMHNMLQHRDPTNAHAPGVQSSEE